VADENFVRRFKQNEVPENMPQVNFPAAEEVSLIYSMAASGVCKSNSEARRAIDQGGVKLNGEKVSNVNLKLSTPGEHIVQNGKRSFARIIIT
jgi:tyrosyl-tRNA synthetase